MDFYGFADFLSPYFTRRKVREWLLVTKICFCTFVTVFAVRHLTFILLFWLFWKKGIWWGFGWGFPWKFYEIISCYLCECCGRMFTDVVFVKDFTGNLMQRLFFLWVGLLLLELMAMPWNAYFLLYH